jgi:hypothetical protein
MWTLRERHGGMPLPFFGTRVYLYEQSTSPRSLGVHATWGNW